HHAPIESAGAEEGGIEDVRTIRRGDQNDSIVRFEAIHLDQKLIERLLALVVSAAETGASVPADSVDLIDEDDARSVFLSLLEKIANAGGADADEHLDEIGAGDREERRIGLARNRAREKR